MSTNLFPPLHLSCIPSLPLSNLLSPLLFSLHFPLFSFPYSHLPPPPTYSSPSSFIFSHLPSLFFHSFPASLSFFSTLLYPWEGFLLFLFFMPLLCLHPSSHLFLPILFLFLFPSNFLYLLSPSSPFSLLPLPSSPFHHFHPSFSSLIFPSPLPLFTSLPLLLYPQNPACPVPFFLLTSLILVCPPLLTSPSSHLSPICYYLLCLPLPDSFYLPPLSHLFHLFYSSLYYFLPYCHLSPFSFFLHFPPPYYFIFPLLSILFPPLLPLPFLNIPLSCFSILSFLLSFLSCPFLLSPFSSCILPLLPLPTLPFLSILSSFLFPPLHQKPLPHLLQISSFLFTQPT